MLIRTFLLGLMVTMLVTSCASYDFSRRIVKQGNLLPQNNIARLKIGMSKENAGILMGTSLISPMFNNDRWDYAYTLRKGNGMMFVKNLSLYFVHDRLVKVQQNT